MLCEAQAEGRRHSVARQAQARLMPPASCRWAHMNLFCAAPSRRRLSFRRPGASRRVAQASIGVRTPPLSFHLLLVFGCAAEGNRWPRSRSGKRRANSRTCCDVASSFYDVVSGISLSGTKRVATNRRLVHAFSLITGRTFALKRNGTLRGSARRRAGR